MTDTIAPNAACVPSMLDDIQCAVCAYCRFDESSSLDNAKDQTGNGYDLTQFNDPPVVSGKVDGARQLGRPSVTCGFRRTNPESCFSIQQTGSIAGWWRLVPDNLVGGWAFFSKDRASFPLQAEWYLTAFFLTPVPPGSPTNAIQIQVLDTNGQSITHSIDGSDLGFNLVEGTWYFTAAWVDASKKEIGLQLNDYVKPVKNYSASLVPPTNGQFNMNTTANFATIQCDEWGIFDRVLTGSERNYLYNSGSGRRLF